MRFVYMFLLIRVGKKIKKMHCVFCHAYTSFLCVPTTCECFYYSLAPIGFCKTCWINQRVCQCNLCNNPFVITEFETE